VRGNKSEEHEGFSVFDGVCGVSVVHTMSGIEPPNGGTVSPHRKAGGNILRGGETPYCNDGEAIDADADDGV